MKKFAAFDIDGTIFRWQLYHELFDALVEDNLISPEDAANVLDARENWRKRSAEYEEYEHTLVNVMQKAIVGIDEKAFHAIADKILQEKGHHVYRYTLDLLKQLQTKGYTTIAISGSYHELVERFCQLHKIDIAVGRKYEVVKGRFTEKSLSVFGRKNEILKELVEEHGLDWAGSYAVGDSGGDITMLELVENPIAFNPDQTLRAVATERGWPIVIERKSLAYRLEKGSDGTYVLAQTN